MIWCQASIEAPIEDSDEFALSVANRSAAFFYLKKYKECLNDIDLAIAYGYPSKSRIKLIARKASCENELKKLITNPNEVVASSSLVSSSSSKVSATTTGTTTTTTSKDIDVSSGDEVATEERRASKTINLCKNISLTSSRLSSSSKTEESTTTPADTLTSTTGKTAAKAIIVKREEDVSDQRKKSVSNDSASSLASSSSLPLFCVETREARGKCLISTQVIQAGVMVLTEKAFLTVLHPSHLDKYCYHCLKKVSSKNYQVFPCKSCTQVRFCSSACSSTAHQEYHWVECGFLDLLKISKDFHYSPKMTLKVLAKYGITKCLSVDLSDTEDNTLEGYPGFLDMIEHPKMDTNDYSIASAIITGLLLEKTSNDIMMTKSSVTSLVERVIKHLRQVNVNAVTILSKDVTRNDDAEAIYTESTVGVGVYLTTRLINHSCDPNCRIVRFDRDTLYLMAVRDIAAGEELTISYGGSYRWQIQSKRKQMLKESYFFDCDCSACSAGLQPLTTALACPDCRGPVVVDGQMTCLHCKKTNHVDINSVIKDTTASLKIVQLADTVIDPKNKDAAATSGINPYEVAEKTLDEAHETLSQILYKTHNELSKIQEKRLLCYLKLKKYRKSVEVAESLVQYLCLQYHETYYKIINAILTLLKCQSLYYKQLKAASPLDKNEINIIKTSSLKNIDLLEDVYQKVSSGNDSVIRERILVMKRLFCPNWISMKHLCGQRTCSLSVLRHVVMFLLLSDLRHDWVSIIDWVFKYFFSFFSKRFLNDNQFLVLSLFLQLCYHGCFCSLQTLKGNLNCIILSRQRFRDEKQSVKSTQ